MIKNYTPSTDRIYIIFFTAALALTLISTLLIILEDVGIFAYCLLLFVVLLIYVIIWMTFKINFIIREHILNVKFGPFSLNVDLRNVVKITDRYSLFLTPSLLKIARSNKTISLRCKKKNSVLLNWITIAVNEEKEFIAEVLKHSPEADLELKRIKLD